MDINQVIISGQVSWHKLQMAPNGTFGSIVVKLNLPFFEFKPPSSNDSVRIQNPFVWLNISISKNNDGLFRKSDQYILDCLNSKDKVNLLTTAAKISSWIKKGTDNGPDVENFKLECSSASISMSNRTFGTVNQSTFKGKVVNYEPSGKMLLSCSYMSPKTNEWKNRNIPLLVTGSYEPILQNKKILIFGKVCNITPEGETKLYVATDTIYQL